MSNHQKMGIEFAVDMPYNDGTSPNGGPIHHSFYQEAHDEAMGFHAAASVQGGL
jgi:hypothetical protein